MELTGAVLKEVNKPIARISISFVMSTGGIDYVNDCLCSVSGNFWDRFSVDFARASSGSAYWLGDGQRDGGAFSSSSYFSTVELPNMNADEVVAIVVHRKGKGKSYECELRSQKISIGYHRKLFSVILFTNFVVIEMCLLGCRY